MKAERQTESIVSAFDVCEVWECVYYFETEGPDLAVS